MVTRETVRLAQAAGKKIVLRIDNIPRNSRNRNTGTSRLKDFAQMADLVIYQSEWSREYVGGWLKKEGVVIYNGVDTKIFNKDGEKIPKEGNPQYLYSRYNRDESKRWDEAWYFYQMIHRKNSKAHLWIVGNFSNEQVEYSFDFYNNEKYTYWGVVEDKNTLSVILRSADVLLVPYFNDACSNTILEAMACGCQIEPLVSGLTGGTPGLFNIKDMSIERMASQYLYELQKIYEKNNRI
jgi:glycosyltransferase involved in cell wall biosynthesis